VWFVFIISANMSFHGRSATLRRPVLQLSPLYWLNQRPVVAGSTGVNHSMPMTKPSAALCST
jgi:hypothetical protein